MVNPSISAVTPESIWNTRTVLRPLTASMSAPGPLIVRLLLISSVDESVIVPEAWTMIVVANEFWIASRSEPGPESLVLVTVYVESSSLDSNGSASDRIA
jgi:hypothetical protein